MSMVSRDAGSGAGSDSESIPLEISLPIVASLLTLVFMTASLVHRIYRKKYARSKQFHRSPSLLVLSDPEANRQWLDDLKRLKELGLGRLREVRRACSLGWEVKCRGLGDFDDNTTLIGLPTRPQTVFFPEGRPRPYPRAVVRRSWIQNLFHSSYDKPLRSRPDSLDNGPMIPEIRITVPSMVADEATVPLPQDRRWSRIIANDIGLASGKIGSNSYTPVTATGALSRNTHSFQHPPNSMDTLPSPARRRLSYATGLDARMKLGQNLHTPLGALSPIRESRESLSSHGSSSLGCVDVTSGADRNESALMTRSPVTQGSLMSAYGLSLLHPSSSLRATANDSSDTQVSDDHSQGSASLAQRTTSSAPDSATDLNPAYSRRNFAFLGSTHTLSAALSTIESYGDGEIALSDSSAESPVTPPERMAQPCRFLVCNGGGSDLCSSSSANLSSVNLDSACSKLTTSLIPSVYIDGIIAAPVPSLLAPGEPPSRPKPDEPDTMEHIHTADEVKARASTDGLAGVELWVDEDVDLFYCPGPTEMHVY